MFLYLFCITSESVQFLKEKNFKQRIPQVKVEDGEEITHETASTALRRAVHFVSALQASDGHWPAENAGPLFYHPPLVMCVYITGHLNIVCPAEHRKEMLRYIYNHQNEDGGWGLHIEGHSTLLASNLTDEMEPVLRRGHEFVKASQVKHDPSGDFKAMYRHISKGSWTFSDQDHGWQVSDCTAEALKEPYLSSPLIPRFFLLSLVLFVRKSNSGMF
ncbi:hypothetical protein Q3G72_017619 [Acer saccharum]|nr:hypothetical protein Q3G72_017619 [Acer saccharum]